MSSENLYWIWLSLRLGAASTDLPRLMLQYDSPYEIYVASQEELAAVENISEQAVEGLSNKSLSEASSIIDYCARTDVRVLPFSDPDYPKLLRLLADPPVLLYVRGKLPRMDDRLCIAIVGTRKMTTYGRDNAFRLAYELASAGAIVVSGLALGIDGVAAGGAITGGGKTVAVLGCGIDRVYPREHTGFASIVEQNGAVVTEFAPGTLPEAQNFPIRNRIISGMCHGTLVVEADLQSGSLITANCANMQGRQMFAIPGNLGLKNASGTNKLIRDGGLIVMDIKDILIEYPELSKKLDIIKMKRAQCAYAFSVDTLSRMGIYSRTVNMATPKETTVASTPRGTLIRPAVYQSTESAVNAPAPAPTQPRRSAPTDSVAPPQRSAASTPDPKPEPKPKPSPKPPAKNRSDRSAEILASLSEAHRRLFAEIPDDRSINTDALTRLGFTVGEVMSIMTTLEIYGLVSALPGGLYIKR